MVRKLIEVAQCDMHVGLGLGDADADGSISINGGSVREYDLCTRCQISLRPLLELYNEPGRRPDEGERKQARKTRRKDLTEAAPAKELPAAEPEKLKKSKRTGELLVCPLPHAQSNNGPKDVEYKQRGGHAQMCHEGKRIWDINWGDPNGLLTEFCTQHQKCKETGLGFMSPRGLQMHQEREGAIIT